MYSRIFFPKSSISCSIGGPINIEQIDVSKITIPSVKMNNFAGQFSYASSIAKDVEFEMRLSAHTSFDGEIDLPWPLGSKDVDGSVDFDSFTEKHSLGNIVMNSGSFSMLAPTSTLGPLVMTIDPIGNKNNPTTVSKTEANCIDMKCTEMPLNTPLGLYFGSWAPIQNPAGPMDLSIEETKMDELKSTKISSPKITMRDIKAQNIIIPSITTDPLEIRSDTKLTVKTSKKMHGSGVHQHGDARRVNWMNGDLTLNVEYVIMRIKGGIEFKNITGSVTTDSAVSEGFDMNLNIKQISIKGLQMCGMNMPEVMVEI